MNDLRRDQRVIIAILALLAVSSAFTFAWAIGDSRVIHRENEVSKQERHENRAAMLALELRVRALEMRP